MKKFFSAFLVFLLVFSTIGPLPGIAATVDFPGSVEGSTVGDDLRGKVTVKMNDRNSLWTITLEKLYGNKDQQGSVLGENDVFSDVPAGLYNVRAVKKDDETTIKISAPITVMPKPLSVKDNGDDTSANIIIEKNDPYQLKVKNVATQSKVRLYVGDQTNFREASVDSNGTAIFTNIDANNTYRLTQVMNEAESERSGLVTVYPTEVKLEWKKDSGSSNNAGELLVTGTKKGNTLILYRGGNEYKREVSDTSSFTFKGLPDGSYRVGHVENEVHSKNLSNEIIIRNEQLPIIDLVDSTNYELRYTIDKDGKVSEKKYKEPGYKVTDKNSTVYTGTTTKYFCSKQNVIESADEACDPLKMKVEVVSNVPGGDNNATPPGKYTVTYTATDGENFNLTSTAIRNITIYPNEVILSKTDTKETHNSAPIKEHITGKITVSGVYAGAKLLLYQDPSGSNKVENATLIRSNIEINDGVYSFSNVPVGEGYFVIQEANGVQSSSSKRIDIKDTTPPELTVNGPSNIVLEVGDIYIEHGATAIDNIDTPEELAGRIVISGTVDTNKPGSYTVTYNVKDKAGNSAGQVTRTVIVKPRPVIAIGSIATIGEVGVKNIFPGTADLPTLLKLYKSDEKGVFTEITSKEKKLSAKEETYVFNQLGPGRYYVTQTINGQESRQSNVVEVVDIDKPYITLDGPDKIDLIWDEDHSPYYTKTDRKFSDPGATASDYLEKNLTLTAKLVGIDGTQTPSTASSTTVNQIIKIDPITLPEPGTYKITYTATANRGTVAEPKHRFIQLAPPKTKKPESVKSEISVGSLFGHTTTRANLYNTYGQLIDTKAVDNGSVQFDKVPAGIGYYVTQTVNGIESKPSLPVNVSIFDNAEETNWISSFEFPSLKAVGVIDHKTGTIDVVVPKGTDRSKLKPTITTSNLKSVSPASGIQQDFTKKVTYTVSPGNNEKKYVVTVSEATISTVPRGDALIKPTAFTSGGSSVVLTSVEKANAVKNGVSFIGKDRAIHVPAANIAETQNASLSVKTPTTISNYSDPAWRTSITQPTEINWGEGVRSFMQPIEIELPNPDKKKFARITRVNGQLFAEVQNSRTQGGNEIGLVTQPGTYALIDDIAKPSIITTSDNEGVTYRLYTSVKDAKIYYTTSSQNITFDRSAWTETTNYSLDHLPTDFSEWTLYTSGTNISSSNGEIYAFVVKDGLISPIAEDVKIEKTEWRKDVPTYVPHKVLSITFNARVEKKSLYNGTIYVIDDSMGKKVDTVLSLSPDGKTILVAPKNAYSRGNQYTLHIERQFKGNTKNNEFLKQPFTRTFKIQ
ncbi:DUF5011 domain-containing protein [Sporosarcina obsidiansis]|uniref:DUF5011 domain-containing protein n=1 Tax=Sporosarcina obsidiansis TaxID=2660748 RepID=UPI00129BF31C|nr:DUF5011 domain-containing protein [Sporosarcina obsidiansis]